MRPDIIVHRRNSADNVLAVEMKANANPATTNDKDKLKCLKAGRSYLYKGTAFVCIRNSVEEIEGGFLSAEIEWFNLVTGDLVREAGHCEIVNCRKHSDQVKKLAAQRKTESR